MKRDTINPSRINFFVALLLVMSLVAAACSDNAESGDTTTATAAETTTTVVATTVAETTTTTAGEDGHDHEGDGHDHDEDKAAVVEVAERRSLLIVTASDQPVVDLIDLADGSVQSVELGVPAGFNSALDESGRYLMAGDPEGVTLLDTGVWSEPHGSHFHHYTTEPAVIGRVEGPNSSHLISHDGLNALWFDGTGGFSVITQDSLEGGEPTVMAEVATGQPHHGFAVPTHGAFFVTVPTEDMEDLPNVVGIVDIEGTIQAQTDCPAAHGEASLADAVVSACGDGIAVMTEDAGTWTGSYLPYPEIDDEDPFGTGSARVWILFPAPNGSLLVGPHGSQHLVVATSGTIQSIDLGLGATIAALGIGFVDDDHALVLTLDGFVHLVDPEEGSVVTSVEVVAPFQDDFRRIVVAGDHAYLPDPTTDQVIEIAVGDDELTVERTFELDFTPGAFIGVANG